MLKRIMAIVLTVSLGLTALAGCKGKEDQKDTSSNVTQSSTASSNKKLLTISWLTYGPLSGIPLQEGTMIQKIVEEKFNVKIQPVQVDWFNKEQVNLLFAEGKMPDVYSISGDFDKLIDQGMIREIPEKMLRSKMPKSVKTMEELAGNLPLMSTTRNGKLYGIPSVSSRIAFTNIMAIRKDWMDNTGIKKVPETLSEFEDMLKKFTLNDPDKNGKNDTYGLSTWQGNITPTWDYIFGAFGVAPRSWMDVDKKVVYGGITDGYKEALKVLQSWYKQGLIDKEFMTNKRDVYRDKYVNGQFGIINDNPWWLTPNNNQLGPVVRLMEKDPNVKVEYMKAFKGPNGKAGAVKPSPIGYSSTIVFGNKASDEVVERVIEILEAPNADYELFKLFRFGKEGEHHTVQDGALVLNKEVTPEKICKELGTYYYTHIQEDEQKAKAIVTKPELPAHEVGWKNPEIPVFNSTLFGANPESVKQYSADASKVMEEYMYNAITGKLDIDSTWDSYVANWKKSGGDEMLKDLNEMYKKVNSK